MTTSTDRAREKLQVLLDIGSDQEFGAYCDLLALAIKQHESLRREHAQAVAAFWGGLTRHCQAIEARDYKEMSLTCPECSVLLQWEQMWEEKKGE